MFCACKLLISGVLFQTGCRHHFPAVSFNFCASQFASVGKQEKQQKLRTSKSDDCNMNNSLTLWFTHNPYLLWGYKDLTLCCLTWQKMSKQKYLKNIFSLCLRQGKAAGYCGHMAFVRRLSGEINFNFGGKSFR